MLLKGSPQWLVLLSWLTNTVSNLSAFCIQPLSDIVPVLQLDNEVSISTTIRDVLANKSDIDGTILGR